MSLIFNITDNYEIFTTIAVPGISNSWQAIDFCNQFYEVWIKKDVDIMDRHSYEFLSHNYSLRGLVCGYLCGAYQSVLDFDYTKITHPKFKLKKFGSISQKDPYMIINPELIKLVNQNETSMMVMFSISDFTFYFKNVFDTFNCIDDLNLRLCTNFNEGEIMECFIGVDRFIIKANEIKKFNDWVYFKLYGIGEREEYWLFRSNFDKKYYKLIN